MRHPFRHNQRGFSLMEVMIGVSILAVLGLLIQTVTTSVLNSKSKVEARDALLHEVRTALNRMTDDLAQAFMAKNALKGPETLYNTGFKGTEERMDFSTLSHLHIQKNSRDTDQVTVGYFSEARDNGFRDLWRRESRTLGEKVDAGGEAYRLISNVKAFKLSYYDAQKEEWVAEWDSAELSQLNRLPQAVTIELEIVQTEDDESREVIKEHAFKTTVPIDLYKNEIDF